MNLHIIFNTKLSRPSGSSVSKTERHWPLAHVQPTFYEEMFIYSICMSLTNTVICTLMPQPLKIRGAVLI